MLNECPSLPCVSLLKESPTQIVLFSATFPDRVRNFASKFAPNANKIELKKEELSVEGIKQFYMDCTNEEAKYEILVQIYNLLTVGQSIIFTKVSSLHVLPVLISDSDPFLVSINPSLCASHMQ